MNAKASAPAQSALTYFGSVLPAVVFHGEFWSVNWAEDGKLVQKKFPNALRARDKAEAFAQELRPQIRTLAS